LSPRGCLKRKVFAFPRFHHLTIRPDPTFVLPMQRVLLKSKLHRAIIKQADIEIPSDLMEAAGFWEGERVLVTSMTAGGRLETYVQAGEPGTGHIIMNGGAAHLIKKGERVTIMAFAVSDEPIVPRRHVLNDDNVIIKSSGV